MQSLDTISTVVEEIQENGSSDLQAEAYCNISEFTYSGHVEHFVVFLCDGVACPVPGGVKANLGI